MIKWQRGAFLIITLLFTIGSRLIGVTGLYYNNSMSNWMTGLFFGTRLFEFTLGMFLGYMYNKKHISFRWNHATFLVMGLVIYIVGFMLSWTYLGSLISNIFVTFGLSIIFIIFYQFLRNMPGINKTILFIGTSSFPAFLIHQPFMIWLSGETVSITGLPYLLTLIAVISLPVGYLLERFVNKTVNMLGMKIQGFSRIRVIEFILIIIFVLHFLINLAISFFNHELINKVFTIYSLGLVLLFPLILIFGESFHGRFKSFIVIYLFLTFSFQILPEHWIGLFWVTILTSVIIMFLASYTMNSWIRTSMVSLFLIVILFSGMEVYLRIYQPIEAKRWGEYPALQHDSITIYSLKSNKKTRLKYNNYDYLLKTNSIGFNSPPIPLKKEPNEIRIFVMGDAFTMPEGFEYTKAYPFILETILREKFPEQKLTVINAGVTGYGPNEWKNQLKKYISLLKPDFIVNQFFINEYEEIHFSKQSRLKNIGLDKEFSLKRELFFHAQIPAWYKKLLISIVPSREEAYNYYKSHVFLYDKERAEYYYSDSAICKMKHYLTTIKQLSDSAGAKIAILYVPGQINVSRKKEIDYYPDHLNFNDSTRFDKLLPYKATRKLCEETDIQLINLKHAFDTSQNGPFYFRKSWHWTQRGHEIAARGLYNYLITDTMFIH
jgi:hypothetical protein